MAKVLGLGGIFFKADDTQAVRDWYARVLGFEIHSWGGAVFKNPKGETTTWSPFAADTKYFEPGTAPFMINFIVDDIDGVAGQGRRRGRRAAWAVRTKAAWGVSPGFWIPQGSRLSSGSLRKATPRHNLLLPNRT
jgi:catechol 2,3-dioxygenase-like lactoylglutathione lyase family enzyme